ncbi:MAG TPA: tyrosine-type recombinase/integrase [Verrucomicrobiae bacterium]|jgi:site-specific recombinase XerD|nr:tyrosine-type recombinase/integrase [Verrucomicrobiae bacterium]
MDLQILAASFYEHSIHIKGHSRHTIRRCQHAINYYAKFSGATVIEAVTGASVREMLLDGRVRRGWKPGTFIAMHKSLAAFFRWCVERGHMPANPVDGIELPRLEKRLPSRLRKQDAMKLLEVAANYPYRHVFLARRNHAIFATFVYAGLRRSELLSLRVTDVDLENMTIFVNRGKGAKDRIVPICSQLALALKRYLIERKRLGKTCPEFFASFIKDMRFTVDGMNVLISKMRKATGIKFSSHRLRHTFATLMLEGGCDIYSLSRMMGHSDIKTTTIYLSASAEHLRSQILKHPLNVC